MRHNKHSLNTSLLVDECLGTVCNFSWCRNVMKDTKHREIMKISNIIPEQFEENEAYLNIIRRVSVRRYTGRKVSEEEVSAILHAAMSAPSAVNRQPWEFIVVDDPKLLLQLADAHVIGLGGVWTCLYPHEERIAPVRKILNLSDELVPFNLIPIGCPEREHAPMDKRHPERVHQNGF